MGWLRVPTFRLFSSVRRLVSLGTVFEVVEQSSGLSRRRSRVRAPSLAPSVSSHQWLGKRPPKTKKAARRRPLIPGSAKGHRIVDVSELVTTTGLPALMTWAVWL
jgi:hypothetical protein